MEGRETIATVIGTPDLLAYRWPAHSTLCYGSKSTARCDCCTRSPCVEFEVVRKVRHNDSMGITGAGEGGPSVKKKGGDL